MDMTTPLEYVERGWKVFPCYTIEGGRCTCTKGRECSSPGKHPITKNGVKDATDNTDLIKTWMERWPTANWAVACGATSGIIVIDVDPRKDGFNSIEELETMREDGPLPDTLQSNTGGAGRHYIFAYPHGAQLGNRNGWMSGVDVKSDGGYVILPEAEHISGGVYTWANWGTPIVPLPMDILQMLLRPSAASTGSSGLADIDDILKGVPEGERDETLFRTACSLRRKLGDGAKDAVMLLILRAAANCDPPFPEAEARIKVESAWKMDHTDDFVDWALGGEDPTESRTDRGNARRYRDAFREKVRYVNGWGWVTWTDTGWRVGDDATAHAEYLAQSVPDLILDEARTITDPKEQARHVSWAHKTQSSGAISAVTKLAQNMPELRRSIDEFDADDHVLNCRNGIVDLRSGEMRMLSQDDLITKNTGVIYDPTYKLPEWDRFLEYATDGDLTLMEYLQRAAGYTLTGSNTEECFFIISGPPASGKSTYVDALHCALGQYGTVTNSDTFMYQRGKQSRQEELARFVGMRMVSMSEIREGAGFDEQLIKQFTGGDRVLARFLYQNGFSFKPKLKLWIATNHDPDARDDAIWRRLKKVTFPNHIPHEKRDPQLKLLLQDPEVGGRAVLAWAVEGAVKWHKDGLQQPLTVTLEVDAYHQEQDRASQFINDCLTPADGVRVSLNEMYAVYKQWCIFTSEHIKSQTRFTKMMASKGVRHERVGRQTEFFGYRLRQPTLTSNGVHWT